MSEKVLNKQELQLISEILSITNRVLNAKDIRLENYGLKIPTEIIPQYSQSGIELLVEFSPDIALLTHLAERAEEACP